MDIDIGAEFDELFEIIMDRLADMTIQELRLTDMFTESLIA